MVQDWGFNYIYLRQEGAVTRVNLKDHSFRDVARTPVEDFDSETTNQTKPSWLSKPNQIWMCGASDNGEDQKGEDKDSEVYTPEPFPEHEFEPMGWPDILATLDVCTNEVNPTLFCDEEGYDLFSFQMVNVLAKSQETIEENPRECEVRAHKMRFLLLTARMLANLGKNATTPQMTFGTLT